MKTCKTCGTALPDAARICKECGAMQEVSTASAKTFSMPYLSAPATVKPTAKKTTAKTPDTPNHAEPETTASPDAYLDPRERAFAKQDRRNKLIRITIGILICCAALIGILYLVFRTTGYEKALDQYVTGRMTASASNYTAIVPERYLIQTESAYGFDRPKIRDTINGYFDYVRQQMEKNFGANVHMSYDVLSEKVSQSEYDIAAVEEKLSSQYHVTLDVTDVATVTIRLTTAGDATTNTETSTLTFYQTDSGWYSMEAMESIKFACENAGYNLW